MTTESLIIEVNEKGALVVKRNLEDIGKGGKRGAGGVQLLTRALGGLVAAGTVTKLLQTADAFTEIQNRLRLVTDSTEELNQTTDKLLAISQRTRSDLGSNVELFNRITLATRELGTSQEEVLAFTESLNQAVKISGATATEASAGIIQLSQGLASGALRGDELRSVLEQLPAVADVIAKSLGVTRGRLRELGQEGKISAEVVLQAFKEARGELDERFKKTVGTTAEELVKVRNAVTVLVGRFFEATGASNALAGALNSVTEFIERITPQVVSLGRAFSGTLTPTDEMSAGMKIFATTIVVVQSALAQLVNFLDNTVGAAFSIVGETIGGSAAAISQFFQGNFEEAGKILDDLDQRNLDRVVKSGKELRDALVLETTDTIEQIVQIWDEGARLTAEAQRMIFEGPSEGGSGVTTAATIDPELQKVIDAQNKLLASLQLQEAALAEAQSSGRDYAAVLQDMQIQALAAKNANAAFAFDAIETANEIRRLEQAISDQNNAIEEGKRLTESLRTPQEVYNDALARNVELLQAGAISTDTFNRATSKLFNDLQEALKPANDAFQDFLKRARENAQDILGDALANAFTGGFDELPGKFAQVLLELSSQLLASELFKLLGNLGSSGGGGFFNTIAGFFAGGFANGGQFVVPGSGGTDSQLVTAKMTPGEVVTVQTPQQARAGADAPQPVVNVDGPTIVNTIDDSDIVGAINRSGGQVIINKLAEDRTAARQALGIT